MKTYQVKLKEKQDCPKCYQLSAKEEDYLINEYNRQLERVNNRFNWPAWIHKNWDWGGQHHMRSINIREMINTQKRKAIIAVSSGMAVFVVSILISTVYTIMFPIALFGFAVALGGITFLEFGLSCPECRSRIGYAVNYPGRPFAVSSKIRFCPFCGVSFDSRLKPYKHNICNSSNPNAGIKVYVTIDKNPDSR